MNNKYSRQKKYSKKLNRRTVKFLLRLYIGKDDDLIGYLSNKSKKSDLVKQSLREFISNHPYQPKSRP